MFGRTPQEKVTKALLSLAFTCQAYAHEHSKMDQTVEDYATILFVTVDPERCTRRNTASGEALEG